MKTIDRRSFVCSAATSAAAIQLGRYAFASSPTDGVACTLIAEQEVGPFYVPDELLRSNIAENKPGVPLSVRITIQNAHGCTPLANAAIDLWHCDASGVYSGYTKANFGPPGGDGPEGHRGPPPDGPPPEGFHGEPPAMHTTEKLTFLRGIQRTGPGGEVFFQTIFPGFYQGRVNHIHFKVRVGGHAEGKTCDGGHTSHTGQIFFPEELTLKLMKLEPYVSHGIQRTTAAEDDVYTRQHGYTSVAQIEKDSAAAGYHAEIAIAVDPDATPAPASRGFGGPPGG